MTQAVSVAQGGSFNQTMRNRIINGNMVIDQRNAGASVTPLDSYTLDRWRGYASAASKYTVQQNAGSVTPPSGYVNYLGATSSSAYSVSSSDYFAIVQNIEGLNVADLGWGTANAQTVTVSFWVRSSLTGTFGGSFVNSGYTRCYPFTYTISAANTWEQKTVTITGDTTGTWLTTNGVGVRVWFGLGAGSSQSGTAGSWQGAGYVSATGAVSVVGTSGATFYITGVQLEAGSAATPFEYRPYGMELTLCQRYYETCGNNATAMSESGGTNPWVAVLFAVPKRAAPSIGLTNGSKLYIRRYGVSGYAATSAAWATGYVGTSSAVAQFSGFSGLTAGAVYLTSGYDDPHPTVDPIYASAEL